MGPVLGDVGLWALNCLLDQAKEQKDTEMKKKLTLCIDIIEKYLDSSFGVLGDEKKYNFMNKFGPKKCPEQRIARSDLKNVYAWLHYAPLQWFEHIKRTDQELKNQREGKTVFQKLCSSC